MLCEKVWGCVMLLPGTRLLGTALYWSGAHRTTRGGGGVKPDSDANMTRNSLSCGIVQLAGFAYTRGLAGKAYPSVY